MSPEDVAFMLISLVIKLIGYEAASKMVLSQKQIDEANIVADALEDAKFPKK